MAVDERDEPVYKHAERIELNHLLAPDFAFVGIVERLEAEWFYRRNEAGASGLDSEVVHTKLGEPEMQLRDLLDAEAN